MVLPFCQHVCEHKGSNASTKWQYMLERIMVLARAQREGIVAKKKSRMTNVIFTRIANSHEESSFALARSLKHNFISFSNKPLSGSF